MTELDFVVSATQVSAFELCPRKWAWRYIDGVESPPNKYAELGLDTHGHLEDWLRSGKVPVGTSKSVQLAQALIPHLPPPQSVDPSNVELDQYYSLCGVTFNLKVDLFMPKWGDWPRVIDHKTCGDFKWALTADRLPQDVQGSLYAGWALHKTYAERVDLQWNYVCTKGAIKTQPVLATVSGRDIQERLGKTLESARQMRVIAESGVRALQVDNSTRTPGACSAFGGCPHLERCGITPQERLSAVIAQGNAAREKAGETMGSTEDFLASIARGGGGPQNGASAQPTQQQPPMQYAPAPAQQQPPMQYAAPAPAPAPAQQQPPMQYAAPAPAQQAPMQYPAPQPPPSTQQAPLPFLNPPQPTAQAPMPLPTQAAPAAAPAAAAPAPVGRPPKVKATDDPWVWYSKVALEQLVVMRAPPEQAAAAAAQYADYMVAELARRK